MYESSQIASFLAMTIDNLSLSESKRGRVHAIAQSRRLRAIIEDMAEMCATIRADDFGSRHSERVIRDLTNSLFIDLLIKAGPAGTRFEFCFRIKECLIADDAMVNAVLVVIPILSSVRTLGTFFLRNVILLRCEPFTKLGIGGFAFVASGVADSGGRVLLGTRI